VKYQELYDSSFYISVNLPKGATCQGPLKQNFFPVC
jgi:hypothetical protein